MNQDPNTVQNDLTPPVIQPDMEPTVEEQPSEEPVMITANIDEMPQDQIPESILSQNELSQVNEPVIDNSEPLTVTPDLGKEEQEEAVPTFQQFADIPNENQPDVIVEEQQVETTPVESLQSRVEMTVESTQPEVYQAVSQAEINAPFQQLGEIPVEGQDNIEQATLDSEENEETSKKSSKLLLFIILIILIALLVLELIFVVIPSFRNGKAGINKQTVGNINVALVGDVNSTKDALFVKLTESDETTEHECQDESSYDISYSLMKNEISSGKRKYNLRYPCGYPEFFKYAILSDELEKIDGAILVLKASDSVQSQTIEIASALNKVGVERIIVFISKSDDDNINQTAKKDVMDLLSAKGYDNTKTPIIIGNIENSQDISKLLTEADSWFKNTKYEEESYAVQKHKKVKVYTYLKTIDEGGEATPMQDKDTYTFKIEKEIKGEIILPGSTPNVTPGNAIEVTIDLEEKQAIQEGMKIPYYKDSKVVAVGIVEEIIE